MCRMDVCANAGGYVFRAGVEFQPFLTALGINVEAHRYLNMKNTRYVSKVVEMCRSNNVDVASHVGGTDTYDNI